MLTRRRFLAASSAAVVGTPWVRSFAAGEDRDKVRLGVIGVADRGAANLAGVAAQDIVALCEVDEPRAAKARQQFPKAAFFTDYRQMYDAAGKTFDAVVVSTPDHSHAAAAVRALKLGKHVYCEKPLAKSVAEVRAMRAAATEAKVVTQMGTQIHAGENYRRVVEYVQSGVLGEVERVRVWCERRPDAGKRLPPPTPGLAFDLDQWLGPVPTEFFYATHPKWPHFNWRWWWEFGGGVLQDMGCHFLDLAFWALGLTAPTRVTAAGTSLGGGADNTVPKELCVEWTFPRSGRPDLPVTWHHGNPGPYLEADADPVKYPGYASGVAFVTKLGTLVSDYSKHKFIPAAGKDVPAAPARSIPKSLGHHAEWLAAIRGTGQALCGFDYAGPLTEAVLLGNVAYRTGGTLDWDAKTATAAGTPKAAELLNPPRRPGWELG